MNRTVYYHHAVKVLEFMMEHFLRLVIDNMGQICSAGSVAPFVPPYLKRVAVAVQHATDKATLMAEGYQDYVRLTEDDIWSLVSAAADGKVDPVLKSLAQDLLSRKILRHFAVKAGKSELLRDMLVQEGFAEGCEFQLRDLKTTMYKGDTNEGVFVLDWEETIDEVAEHSEMIAAFRDRPEAESLLIVIDPAKVPDIKELAKKGQFIVVRDVA